MKKSLKLDELRENTFTKLIKSLNTILDEEHHSVLNETIRDEIRNESLYYQILVYNIYSHVRSQIIDFSIEKDRYINVEEKFNYCHSKKDIEPFIDFKDQFQKSFLNTILKEIDFPDLENFSFRSKNQFLNQLELVNVFIHCIHEFRYEKYKYFVQNDFNEADLNPESSMNLEYAFPDAYKKFNKLIKNRIDIFYAEELIDYYETNIKKYDREGNIELFDPDSDFATIFNDYEGLENLPNLTYQFIKTTGYELKNPFFERLNIFLRHCKFNNHVLMPEKSQEKFKKCVGQYLGKEYKYEQDKFNSNKYDKFEKELISYYQDKGLIIKGMYE